MNDILYVYSGSSDDAGLNEFFVLNAETHTLSSKGRYPESSTSRFKSISDFKFAYAHEIQVKPDGDRILVSYIRTRRFRIYDIDFNVLIMHLINMLWMQTLIVGRRLLKAVLLPINIFICYVRKVRNPVWL
mgnify:FL=1